MKNPTEELQISETFLKELSYYFDYTGLNNPFNKVYLTTKSAEEHPTIMFMLVITNLTKIFLVNASGTYKRTNDSTDGAPFIVGICTILKQLHSDVNEKFIEIMTQYIMNLSKSSLG